MTDACMRGRGGPNRRHQPGTVGSTTALEELRGSDQCARAESYPLRSCSGSAQRARADSHYELRIVWATLVCRNRHQAGMAGGVTQRLRRSNTVAEEE